MLRVQCSTTWPRIFVSLGIEFWIGPLHPQDHTFAFGPGWHDRTQVVCGGVGGHGRPRPRFSTIGGFSHEDFVLAFPGGRADKRRVGDGVRAGGDKNDVRVERIDRGEAGVVEFARRTEIVAGIREEANVPFFAVIARIKIPVIVRVVIRSELEDADRLAVRAGLQIELPAAAHGGVPDDGAVLEEGG